MKRAPSVWAVVPVKPFDLAKRRLAPVLTSGERAALARVMFEDVLETLMASRDRLAGVLVVTADRDAALLARRRGAAVVAEGAPQGINAALALAIARLAAVPDAAMLVVPTDVPQLAARAIDGIVAALQAPRAVAVVPAIRDGGTNLLGCRPANVIVPCFGTGSFRLHCDAARRAGVLPASLAWSRLGDDIDRPDDLATFLSFSTDTRTHLWLTRFEKTA